MLRISPVTAVVAVLIAGASVAGCVLTKHNNGVQARTLLANQTSQAALYANGQFGSFGSTLASLATVTQLTGGSASAFDTQTRAYQGTPLEVALARRSGDAFVVVAGSGFSAGSPLPASLTSTLASVGADFTPTPVMQHGDRTTVGFAVGPPAVPAGDVVYMQFTIDPYRAIPASQSRPFGLLDVALYGAPRAEPGTLVVATRRALPLRGELDTASVAVGTGRWTLVTSPRRPLLGSAAEATPWIVLGLGLLVALFTAATLEVLSRRQRYARQLVEERTAELLASQEALVRSERLSAVGEMTTVIGHELRNPLAAVTNAHYLIRMAAEDGDEEALGRHLALADRETARAAALAEDLTAYMRERRPVPEPISLDQVIEEVLESTRHPQGVTVTTELTPVTLEADDRQMHQILTNLVTNAFDATRPAGEVHLQLSTDGGGVVVVVEDDGPGFSDATVGRAFEPFYTTKSDGTGLGLAIVRRLVEGHGGDVELANRAEGGARVTIRLPMKATPGT